MERYINIARVNLKYFYFSHILAALIICLISPLIMGVKNLDPRNTAKILEVYISLLGIILLVPVFYPDQDLDIRDLIRSKKESLSTLHILRTMEAFVFLISIVFGFLVFLKINHCSFPLVEYLYGTLASCIFLGGMGIFVYSMIDNLPIAYMVPMLYYMLCFGTGKKYLGKFYLFSMLSGTVADKIYLWVAGMGMLAIGIFVRGCVHKHICFKDFFLYIYRKNDK